jgi:hypothetical protein
MPDDQIDQTGTDPAGTDDAQTQDVQKTPEEQLAELTAALDDLKKNSRKWEDRAKSNADKAKQFDALQAATATDADKLKSAEERATAAERELARYRVAQRTKLDLELVDLLNGDEDAMEEQAKKLLARIAPEAPKRPAPKSDRSQGGGTGSSTISAADEGRAEAQRRAALRQKKS